MDGEERPSFRPENEIQQENQFQYNSGNVQNVPIQVEAGSGLGQEHCPSQASSKCDEIFSKDLLYYSYYKFREKKVSLSILL